MSIYALSVTGVAFILAALLLREKFRRTEAIEEVEVLREQFKDLRTIIENDRAEYMRAYNTLREAGYKDNGHPLWTPPDLERTARKMVGQDESVPLKINLPLNSFEDDWNASGMDAYDDL